MKNHATASKDRTGLFFGKPEQKLSVETGKLIRDWCNQGMHISIEEVEKRINQCKSVGELLDLYKQHLEYRDILKPTFEQRKKQILIHQEAVSELTNQKIHTNGTAH
jgi:hypothetical protein